MVLQKFLCTVVEFLVLIDGEMETFEFAADARSGAVVDLTS